MTSPIFKDKKDLLLPICPPLSYHPIFLLPFKTKPLKLVIYTSGLFLPFRSLLDPRQPGTGPLPHQRSGTLSSSSSAPLLMAVCSRQVLLLPPCALLSLLRWFHLFHQAPLLYMHPRRRALNTISTLLIPKYISPSRPPSGPQIHTSTCLLTSST